MHLWEATRRPLQGPPVGRRLQPDQRAGRRDAARSSGRSTAPRGGDPGRSTREHILFLDGNRYSRTSTCSATRCPNTVYTAHDYALPGFADGGAYPGVTPRRATWTATLVERDLPRAAPSTCAAPAPRSGSASSGRSTPAIPDATTHALPAAAGPARDLPPARASWALWTYKDIGLQGARVRRPGLRLRATHPARAREEGPAGRRQPGAPRTRGCGTSWSRSRSIFAEEFPGFDPFPWGSQRLGPTLVRHILLAEPMVADFGRCFEGLSPDEAEALADSFRLDRCVQRRRLVEILRARRETGTPASLGVGSGQSGRPISRLW